MKIVSAEVVLCSMRLPHPIMLRAVAAQSRDYLLLNLKTDAGIDGFGIAYRSGTALLEITAALAPKIVGLDPLMRQKIIQSFDDSMAQARASIVRAVSLIDQALWDIAAKAAGMPLYKMLGGYRQSVPAIAVSGFSYAHRDHEAVADALRERRGAGVQALKG